MTIQRWEVEEALKLLDRAVEGLDTIIDQSRGKNKMINESASDSTAKICAVRSFLLSILERSL